jgi:cAMP phosphodiesterase
VTLFTNDKESMFKAFLSEIQTHYVMHYSDLVKEIYVQGKSISNNLLKPSFASISDDNELIKVFMELELDVRNGLPKANYGKKYQKSERILTLKNYNEEKAQL